MRRIDALWIGLGVFIAGGLLYGGLQAVGVESATAGIWSQAVLVGGLVVWLLTYVLRAVTGRMTYHQQRRDYEEAALQKRLESLTPEELAQLQAEIEQEQAAAQPE
ncbi:DUF3007 family protein [Pantanalinema rosaneae CENA516]|uniref:DUF3007 family protein n=1 Tax=Pantanalinema rosaneae TaxID=1620701 RepID=UPI003D6EBF9A